MNTKKPFQIVGYFLQIVLVFALLLFLPFLLFGVGSGIGTLSGVSMEEAGINRQAHNLPWKELESSYKFVEIVNAIPEQVLARTKEGSLYHWKFTCDPSKDGCGQWIEVQTVPEDFVRGVDPMRKGETCPDLSPDFKEAPPSTVECALGSYWTVVWIAAYYALLEDGTIWYWHYPAGNDYPIVGSFVGVLGSIVGLIVGIILDVKITSKFLVPLINKLRKG